MKYEVTQTNGRNVFFYYITFTLPSNGWYKHEDMCMSFCKLG